MSISFSFTNKSSFYKLINVLYSVIPKIDKVQKVVFVFDNTSLKVSYIDNSGILLILTQINDMENYICSEKEYIEIDIVELFKNMKCLKKKINISFVENLLTMENENGNIIMDINKNVELKEYPNIPDKYTNEMSLVSKDFYDKMNVVCKVCHNIELIFSKDKIMCSPNENTKLNIQGKNNIEEEIKINLMTILLKHGTSGEKFSKEMKIYVKKDFPLYLHYGDTENYIKFIIAPCLD